MENNQLQNFKKQIVSQEAIGIATGIGEVIVDSFLKDGILKDLPGGSTIISLFKMGGALKERHELKKLLMFFSKIRRNSSRRSRGFY